MAKAKRKPELRFEGLMPTPEQAEAFAETWQIADGNRARAYRRTPVIETLFKQKRLSPREFFALDYYQQQATKAEEDMARESPLSPSRIMGGYSGSFGSSTPTWLITTPAVAETNRLERYLGELKYVARAIAVENEGIVDWSIKKYGGIDSVRGIIPKGGSEAVELELTSLRIAAGRIIQAGR